MSNPTNFSHAVHVGFDSQTGEFVGLPPEWSKLLNSSAITKEDYERNPQAVFEVLDFYSDLTKRAENPNQYLEPDASHPGQQHAEQAAGLHGRRLRRPAATNATPAAAQPEPPTARSRMLTNERPIHPAPAVPEPRRNSSSSSSSAQTHIAAKLRRALTVAARSSAPGTRPLRASGRWRWRSENRRDMEAYNASLPKTKTPLAQQEIGGGTPAPRRTGSTLAVPRRQRPSSSRRASLRAQRPAPPALVFVRRKPASDATAAAAVLQQSSLASQSQGQRPAAA